MRSTRRSWQLGRLTRVIAACTGAAAAAGAMVAVATAPATAATGCQATYTITSQWSTGFGAAVTITNLGSAVTSWTAAWTFSGNQQVTQLWNGTVQQSGQAVSVTNASYNGAVATNASVSFGFNGSYSGTNAAPATIRFNGVACTGAVSSGTATPSPSRSSSSPAPPPPACTGSTCVQYNGGANGVITKSPQVYLVFYGSQWNGTGGATQTQAEGFFQGLGKGGERWSTILTQYCNNVPQGTVTCPAGAVHIPYPTATVYGGTWFDSSKPAPAAPGDDLITEARSAAAHFGVTDLSRSLFVIFSPAGTSAGGGFSWHTTTSDGYNVINAAFGEQNTIVLSHEYGETMTDVNAGWTTADKTAEIGDLCGPAGNLNLPTGSFPITSLWSNKDSNCVVGD